jgi:hypothetical protein
MLRARGARVCIGVNIRSSGMGIYVCSCDKSFAAVGFKNKKTMHPLLHVKVAISRDVAPGAGTCCGDRALAASGGLAAALHIDLRSHVQRSRLVIFGL